MKWVSLSILAAFSLAIHSLAMAKMSKDGFHIGRINLNVFFLVFIFIGLQQWVSGSGVRLPLSLWNYIIIAALGAYLVIQLSLMAIATAPNPGYVSGILSLSVVVVALVSYFLFNAHLSASKSIGILLTLIGAYLIGK
ncbi:MAG: EamA family transporter [Nitrospiria bacterium]